MEQHRLRFYVDFRLAPACLVAMCCVLACAGLLLSAGSQYAWATVPAPTPTEHWPAPDVQAAFDAVLAGDQATLEELIAGGLDVNARNVFSLPLISMALYHEDLALCELLLQAGADPDTTIIGQTLLDYAVMQGNLDLARLALKYGANPLRQDELGMTVVEDAASYADPRMLELFAEARVDLLAVHGTFWRLLPEQVVNFDDFADRADPLGAIQYLINYGFEPNMPDDQGNTLLHIMGELSLDNFDPRLLDVADYLIAQGADVNARDERGETPLMQHDRVNQQALFELLLAAGAEINAQDQKGQTVLHHAAVWNPPVVPWLLQHNADPTLRDQQGWTALHIAVRRSPSYNPLKLESSDSAGELVQALLDGGAVQDLAVYAAWGDLDTVRRLVEQEGVLVSDPQLGSVALSLAARLEQPEMARYLIAQGVEPSLRVCVELGDDALLEQRLAHGADPNELNDGIPVIYIAARRNACAAIKALAAVGADLNAKGNYSRNALEGAIREGHQAALVLLLSLGADPNATFMRGMTALHWACMASDPQACRILLEWGAEVQAHDDDGATPLHKAVSGRRAPAALAALLLEHGADVNAQDDNGATPLANACHGLLANQGDYAVLAQLLDAGADPDIPNHLGFTPLTWALTIGELGLAEFLLQHGASPDIVSSYGTTPLLDAIAQGQTDVAELLRRYDATEPSAEIIAAAKKYQLFGEEPAE